MSDKKRLLITIFLGIFGVHYFIDKKYGKGILYLCTGGLFAFGWIWDIITLILKINGYSDIKNKQISIQKSCITLFLVSFIFIVGSEDKKSFIQYKEVLIFLLILSTISIIDIIIHKDKIIKKEYTDLNKDKCKSDNDSIKIEKVDHSLKNKSFNFINDLKSNDNLDKDQIAKNKIINKYKKINPYIFDDGFNIDKEIFYDKKNFIIFDLNKNIFKVANGKNKDVRKYNVSDIIEYEIYENGNSVLKGRVGSTVVGGLLFGGLGAMAGMTRKKAIDNFCEKLQLRIVVNDINNPEIVFNYLSTRINKNGRLYMKLINDIKRDISILKILKNNNVNKEEAVNSEDNYTKLRELNKLLEENVITNQEFENKKKDILNKI